MVPPRDITADLAAVLAFNAAEEAFVSAGCRNEDFVVPTLRDYDRLVRLNIGRYPEPGPPVGFRLPGGPPGPLWLASRGPGERPTPERVLDPSSGLHGRGNMARAIAVLNAGSSSLKFSIFLERAGELRPLFRGQAEGLFTSPRFLVRDPAGATVAETEWPEGTRLGHEGAIEHLFGWAAEVKARLGGGGLTRWAIASATAD